MAWTDDNLGRRRTPGYNYNSDQVQLRVDPRDQLDEEIYGLRGQVAKLKQVRLYLVLVFNALTLRLLGEENAKSEHVDFCRTETGEA